MRTMILKGKIHNIVEEMLESQTEMSLHVGRIPSHIRQDELERVFRRFGRCKLELKDGYGFAVFEVNSDAEKALYALRGKTICGKPLTLNWSNIQPRPLQRYARPTKINEPYRRKNFREDDNRVRTRHSEDQRNFSSANSPVKHRDGVPDRGADYVPRDIDDIGEERGVTMKEGVADVGNSMEPNAMENDRWGEPISGKIAGNEMGNDTDFDRYEPYHGYEREGKKENNQIASSNGSPLHVSSCQAEKNVDTPKPQPTCYNCGLAGHIKRYCPDGDAEHGKFSRFGYRRDEINFRGRNDGKRKMPRISRDPMIFRRNEMDRKESHFGNSKKLARRSESFPERREKSRPKLEVGFQEKKRGEKKHETQKKVPKKRSRRFGSSSLSSNSSTNSSRKHSGTSKPKSRLSSHSPSGSISSKSPSASSSSKSASISSYVKSKSRGSGSQSRSSLQRPPSLSVSLDKKSPSSPNNVSPNIPAERASPKGDMDHPMSPITKLVLHDNMQNFEVKGNNSSITYKIDNEIDAGENVDLARYSPSSSNYKESYSNMNLRKDVAVVSETNRTGNISKETLTLKPNEHIAIGSNRRNSTKITTPEMILALKHYGLPAPKEGESSVGEYFGAARLWPWELIYYRRLKKGPISTENYARRLQQNEEFGIVDRYVRSSSGWGEEQNDML